MVTKLCWPLFWFLASIEAANEIPYGECESNFCFGFSEKSDDCIKEESCTLFVIIKLEQNANDESDAELLFTAYMTNVKIKGDSVWMAIGLSDDQQMGDDAVMDCYTEDTHKAHIRSSMNIVINGTRKNHHVAKDRVYGVVHSSKSFVNGTLKCEWRREKYSNITGQDDDHNKLFGDLYPKTINIVDSSYYVMLAHGLIMPGSVLKLAHKPNDSAVSKNNPFFDIFFVNCEQTASITSKYCFGVDILKDGTLKPCVANKRCHLTVTVKKVENANHFQARISDIKYVQILNASSGVYLAVGLSFDTKMGIDSVTECLFFANGRSEVKDTFNEDVGSNILADKIISNSETALQFENTIECNWKRPFEVEHNGIDFSTQRNAFYVLIAAGQLGSTDSATNGKKKHLKTFTSLTPITFGDFKDEMEKECEDSNSFQCFGFREAAPAEKSGRTSVYQDNCIVNYNCLIRLRIVRLKSGYRFTATGRVGSGSWMAFALSTDEKMGDDVVFECASTSNGTLKGVSWNADKSNKNTEIADGITEKEFIFDKNKLTCTFEVKDQFSISIDGANKTISIANDDIEYRILFAHGKVKEEREQGGILKEKHGVYSSGVSTVKFRHLDYSDSDDDFGKKSNHFLLYISVTLAFILIVTAVVCVFYVKSKSKSKPLQIDSGPAPLKNDEPSLETIESLKGEPASKFANLNAKSAISTKSNESGKTLRAESHSKVLVTSKASVVKSKFK